MNAVTYRSFIQFDEIIINFLDRFNKLVLTIWPCPVIFVDQ